MEHHVVLISKLHGQGHSTRHIHRELQKIDPTSNYYTLRRFIPKMVKSQFGVKIPYVPRSLRGINVDGAIIPTIKMEYSKNSSITAPAIQCAFKKKNISLSVSSIKRFRTISGLKRTTTKYCHSIRDPNKVNRVEFCETMLKRSECFSDWIFSDESTFQVDNSVKHCYTMPGDYHARLKSRNKHSAKLHCWGGISRNGATALAIFDGTDRMNSEYYCEILEDVLLPFIATSYGGVARFAQDNAPTHKSKYTTEWLKEHNVELINWPAESPDLNPIELVWGNMKTHIKKQNVRNVAELKAEMISFWSTLTAEKCSAYINGVPKKMVRVIEQNGRNIHEGK